MELANIPIKIGFRRVFDTQAGQIKTVFFVVREVSTQTLPALQPHPPPPPPLPKPGPPDENGPNDPNTPGRNTNNGNPPNNRNLLRNTLIGLGVGSVVAVAAAPLAIAGLGFGAGGVAAGSIAAAWQSCMGSVAAGSIFAGLQSAGAVGLAVGTQAAIGVGGAAVGAATGAAGAEIRNRSHRRNNNATPINTNAQLVEETQQDDEIIRINGNSRNATTQTEDDTN